MFFLGISSLGGDKRDRTVDPLLAKQVLSQLSYTPIFSSLKILFRAFKIKQHFSISVIPTLDLVNSYIHRFSIERR